MMPQPGFTSFLGSIPSGSAGINATLKIMVSIVRALKKPLPDGSPAPELTLLRNTAVRITQGCPEEDDWCEAEALQTFVRDRIRYVRDIRDVETVQFPAQTLQLGAGDCDDKSLLLSALAESVGFDTRFCAVRMNNEPIPSHVSAQILVRGHGWINAEVIPIGNGAPPAVLGWFPPQATCYRLAHV